ncbi:MAG TPA: M23 family metallopeptidase [Xanthobacteraceae bacterium]|nr:M23 family metallopeptidase [Xanthobacteraceae bacterium]
MSRFGENSSRNSYAARAPASQPAAVPVQPTRTVAVESQPLPQAQPPGPAYAPQYAALQYEQPPYTPPQYTPPGPQYVPPQPVPPSVTPYAPPAPQYPQYPPPAPAPSYAPPASQYTPQSAPSYTPAPRSAPAFTGGAGGGARIADAAAPRTPRPAAVPQAPAAPAPAAQASLPAAPAQAAMPASTSVAGSSAQTLLPTPPVHTVASGDTLGKVAHKYRVSAREIAVANGISPETPLKVGQRLTIPVRMGAPPSAHPGGPQPGGPVVAQTKPPQTYTAAAAAPGKVASSEAAANVRLASPVEPPSAEAGPNGAPAFRWPVRGRIINNFGARVNGSPNDGIDLALPEGTAVRAAEDGVVAYAGNELKGYGNLVLVRHANGFVTAYANASELLVKRNDQVHKGQVILKSGQTGNAATPQLHFEIRKNSAPVDPMQYLPADKTASAPL